MAVSVTLVDPNGREWVAGSAVEVNDLLAQGYRLKGHDNPRRPAPKAGNAPSNVANPAPVTNTGAVQPAGDGSGAK